MGYPPDFKSKKKFNGTSTTAYNVIDSQRIICLRNQRAGSTMDSIKI